MIAGNVVTAGGTATAWYRLAPVSWNWRSEAERDGLIVAGAQVLAALTGHRLHFRVTSSTVTRPTWAARLSGDPSSPLTGWAAHTRRCADHLASLDFHDKAAYLGVELRRRSSAGLWAGLWGRRQVDDVGAVVARPGFNAAPLSGDELEWLYRRSILLGHPIPATSGIEGLWAEDDMPELDGAARWTVVPYARTMWVTAGGRTRHVVTSVIGRMQTLSSRDPWLCLTDRLPFDVEISATVDVLPAEQVQRGVRSMILRALSQREHYGEHQMPPPHTLQAGIDAALEVQAELDQGFGTDLSTRVDGWYRLAVAGDTEAEALARADEIEDLYAPLVTIWRPPAQYALAGEFVPDAKLSTTAHRRRMPVTTAAGAMPQATAQVGHGDGMYLGYTAGAGGRHAVLWATHRAMEERERSGLTLIAGVPGAGKSSLLFQVVYQSTLAGVRWVVLDPGGATARLVDLPELAGHARHTDLMSARPGTLNPYRVIVTPHRRDYDGDTTWRHAAAMTEAQRRQLCGDILQMFLPPAVGDLAESQIALRQALRRVPADDGSSPRFVLDELRKAGGHAGVVAEFLDDVSQLPAAQLIFPTGRPDLDYLHDRQDLRLEVVTMRGLVLPRAGVDRREYTSEEAMAAPLLQLAAYRVAQVMYSGAGRKGIAIDECWQLARVGSGRSLLNDLARQSRKMNTRCLLASQQPGDILSADVANLVDSAFMLRLEDPDAQRDACGVLRIPAEFAPALGTLSAHTRGAAGRSGVREAVFADGEGGVERIVIDLGHLPAHVRAAADTTPIAA